MTECPYQSPVYGLNPETGEMVTIEQAKQGFRGLICPECGLSVGAFKGEKQMCHFRHKSKAKAVNGAYTTQLCNSFWPSVRKLIRVLLSSKTITMHVPMYFDDSLPGVLGKTRHQKLTLDLHEYGERHVTQGYEITADLFADINGYRLLLYLEHEHREFTQTMPKTFEHFSMLVISIQMLCILYERGVKGDASINFGQEAIRLVCEDIECKRWEYHPRKYHPNYLSNNPL